MMLVVRVGVGFEAERRADSCLPADRSVAGDAYDSRRGDGFKRGEAFPA